MDASQPVLAALQRTGHRTTKLRRALLAALEAAETPRSVLELQEALAAGKAAPNKSSLYRELALLTANGFVHETKVSGVRRMYVAASGPHYHATCTSCGATRCLELPGLQGQLDEVQQNYGFMITHHELVLRGVCPRCRHGSETAKPAGAYS